jgi:hypothetical protein
MSHHLGDACPCNSRRARRERLTIARHVGAAPPPGGWVKAGQRPGPTDPPSGTETRAPRVKPAPAGSGRPGPVEG